MAEPMTTTISGWFEENGDFPENLEDPRSLDEVLGDETDVIPR